MGKIGPDSASAIPAIVDYLKRGNEEETRTAVTALGMIGPKAKATVSLLEGLLSDPDPETREEVLRALKKINSG